MNSGTIGEHYSLCELWRKGFNAIKSEDPTNKDWDILILSENSSMVQAKIQVKTIDWNESSSKVISGNFKKGFDFLILIVLNLNDIPYNLFVIPIENIKERPINQSRGLVDAEYNVLFTNKTITCKTINSDSDPLGLYRDNLDLLTSFCARVH